MVLLCFQGWWWSCTPYLLCMHFKSHITRLQQDFHFRILKLFPYLKGHQNRRCSNNGQWSSLSELKGAPNWRCSNNGHGLSLSDFATWDKKPVCSPFLSVESVVWGLTPFVLMIRTGQIHLDTSVTETTMPSHFCCGQLRHSHILNSALQKHFWFFSPFLFVCCRLVVYLITQPLAFCFHCYPGIGFLLSLLSRHWLSVYIIIQAFTFRHTTKRIVLTAKYIAVLTAHYVSAMHNSSQGYGDFKGKPN